MCKGVWCCLVMHCADEKFVLIQCSKLTFEVYRALKPCLPDSSKH